MGVPEPEHVWSGRHPAHDEGDDRTRWHVASRSSESESHAARAGGTPHFTRKRTIKKIALHRSESLKTGSQFYMIFVE